MTEAGARPDPGSFRDHRSRVFLSDDSDAVYRGLDDVASAGLRKVTELSFFRDALERRDIVATEWLDGPPSEIAPADVGDFTGWLRHERLPMISYPYEWSFSMLRDAALLQLRLLAEALGQDIVAKDATPYNVQFVGGRPVFIDIGSFEPYEAGEPWYGYRQFCQLNLYPLMFQAYKDLPFQPWLRGAVEGVTPAEARQVLAGWKRHWKGLAVHVWLHARLEARLAGSDADVKGNVRSAGFNKRLIEANVTKLTSLVEGLEWKESGSEWSSYSDRAHYSDRDLAAKEDFVRRVAADTRPRQAWDVGANDGHFSRIVADHADYVLALDADHLVVDLLYRRLREEGNEKIQPLVVNFADPSPALGWRTQERRPLWDRSSPDLVVYLAVIHHLAITHHVPIPALLDFVRDVSPRAVIEFPDRTDPMVKRILRGKQEGLHADYRLDVFEKLVDERFEVVERQELPSGTRTLFDLRRR